MRRAIILPLLLSTGSALSASPISPATTAVFAGGCYWGMEAVFEHVSGVVDVTSGYAGGRRISGSRALARSGYAEAVRIRFDPAKISYEQLLEIFFKVAHDPSQVGRQGPDIGAQYRSAIFPQNAAQRLAAQGVITRLKKPAQRITTRIEAGAFDPAAADQQDYVRKHPNSPYVVANDLPKLAHLRAAYPNLWRSR